MLSPSLRERIRDNRHAILLLAIVLTFGIRPLIGDQEFTTVVFSLALLLTLLAALYATQIDEMIGDRTHLVRQRRRRNRIGLLLALPALIERVYAILSPTPRMTLVSGITWLIFLAFVTWSLLRTLIRQRNVTDQTIALSVSVYLMLGMTWTMLYIVIFEVQANAFGFNSGVTPVVGDQHAFPTFLYFSLTTISTMGFGDIVPLSLQARFAAVGEGVSGQFYMAILVARLVSMQMNGSGSSSK